MSDVRPQDPDRAARFEQLRFAKKQQWYVAASAVALLAGILAIVQNTQLACFEKALATVFILLIAGFGSYILWRLQKHLRDVRVELDPRDKNPLVRDVDILSILAGLVVISAGVVLYFLWFPHASITSLSGDEAPPAHRR
jgi:hypothetical protein